MKKLLNLSIAFLFVLLVGCNSETISLVSPAKNATLSQHPKEMREFLLLPDKPRRDYFNDAKKRDVLYNSHKSIPNIFKWKSTKKLSNVNIEFALDENFTVPAQEFIISVDEENQTAEVCNFMAGKSVFWRVTGTDENGQKVSSQTGVFKTEDILPRQITIPGVDNVRDVGGWKTADGRRMRQGIIFRSAGFNLDSPDWNWDEKKQIDPKKSRIGETIIKPEGSEYLVKKVGLKTELDLRWDGEVAVMTTSPIDPSVKWIHISSYDYGRLYSEEGKKGLREDFRLFADKANYPIVFHCIAGADRTGTLAYILCGLVGVAEDDLRRDWEVTARNYFSYAKYDQIAPRFDKFGTAETPLSEKIQAFLLSIGVTQEEINAYKTIVLE